MPGRSVPGAALAAARAQAAAVPTYRGDGAAPAVVKTWTPVGPKPVQTANSYDSGLVAEYGFGAVVGTRHGARRRPGH